MSDLVHYLRSTEPQNVDPATVSFLAQIEQLRTAAPDIAQAVVDELNNQRSYLKLIASENYSSLAVQAAMGNLLTDKYAEGFPFHRFYAGCENVDTVESAAANELKALFGVDHAYVQPHSGADANIVAFWSILVQRVQDREIEKLGEERLDALTDAQYEQVRLKMAQQRLLGMSLNSGGHLTHGYRHNISAKMMQAFTYDVNPETGLLDYDIIAAKAREVKPLVLLAGYSAYPRRINFAKMRQIADDVGAVLMVDMAHFAGLVAGKVMTGEESPCGYADLITSTTHKTLRGPRGGLVMCTAEFADTVNKGCPMVLGGPLPHVMAAKAIAFREANTPNFQNYAKQVVDNAQTLAEGLMKRGVKLLTNGTDNHLLIIDVSGFEITGRQAEQALRDAGITCNRNAIPFDKNGPWYTSGVRIGTPALTSLGMGAAEMDAVADLIAQVLKATKAATVERTGKPSQAKYVLDGDIATKVKGHVSDLLHAFPLYPQIPDMTGQLVG